MCTSCLLNPSHEKSTVVDVIKIILPHYNIIQGLTSKIMLCDLLKQIKEMLLLAFANFANFALIKMFSNFELWNCQIMY